GTLGPPAVHFSGEVRSVSLVEKSQGGAREHRGRPILLTRKGGGVQHRVGAELVLARVLVSEDRGCCSGPRDGPRSPRGDNFSAASGALAADARDTARRYGHAFEPTALALRG